MKYLVIPALIVSLLFGVSFAGDKLDFKDETIRINYSLGYQIGGDFKRQGVELNADAVVKGIEDALSGAQPQMTQPKMNQALIELKRKIEADQQAKKRAMGAESEAIRQAGIAFLKENKTKQGVKTTDSGLQYRVIMEGTGKSPGPQDIVKVHYRGMTVDGREFDSSYSRGKPAEFNVSGVIKGWTEGLQLMKEGGKYELYIPMELGYGKRGPLAFQALIFEVELISVN